MNIEQQRINFQRAYVKTDYYKIYYEKANASNSAFSWNNEANRYTWHDVNSAWEMWLAAQQQEGYVTVPFEPTGVMLKRGNAEREGKCCCTESIYKAMIQVVKE